MLTVDTTKGYVEGGKSGPHSAGLESFNAIA
jgi:hypothetical protein